MTALLNPLTAFETAILALTAGALILLAIELVWLWRCGALGWSRIKEMAASYSTLVPAVAVDALFGAALIAVFFQVAALAPWTIPTTWWTALLCLLAVDLTYYWEHRLSHEVRLLWALYHSVHHSSPVYDQSTAYRISFVDFFVSPLFYLPLTLLGFDPILVLTCFGLMLSYQTWLHTESIGKLGILDRFLNTPSNHRVHHGSQPHYLDRNYGGILIVWDRLFGSYAPEGEKPRYGLVKPIGAVNPIAVHLHEALRLWQDLKRCRSLHQALRVIAAAPGAAVD